MFSKSSILVAFLFAAVISAASAAPSLVQKGNKDHYIANNLIVGNILNASRVLARQVVRKEAQEGRGVTSIATISTVSTITYLTVLEERSEASFGAWPSLTSGGPGSTNATIYFSSWPGKPISFVITAYGSR